MSTDTEIGRVANALHTTLNDQVPDRLDPDRIREIAVGATGGMGSWSVHVRQDGAALHDDGGQRVLTIRRESDGSFTVRRDVPPVDDVAIPRS